MIKWVTNPPMWAINISSSTMLRERESHLALPSSRPRNPQHMTRSDTWAHYGVAAISRDISSCFSVHSFFLSINRILFFFEHHPLTFRCPNTQVKPERKRYELVQTVGGRNTSHLYPSNPRGLAQNTRARHIVQKKDRLSEEPTSKERGTKPITSRSGREPPYT